MSIFLFCNGLDMNAAKVKKYAKKVKKAVDKLHLLSYTYQVGCESS